MNEMTVVGLRNFYGVKCNNLAYNAVIISLDGF